MPQMFGPEDGSHEDDENELDGCDLKTEVTDFTSDEDLPIAEGGVA